MLLSRVDMNTPLATMRNVGHLFAGEDTEGFCCLGEKVRTDNNADALLLDSYADFLYCIASWLILQRGLRGNRLFALSSIMIMGRNMAGILSNGEEERIARCVLGCNDPSLGEILRTAGRAALAAGNILRGLYDQPHLITHKGAIDLVTEADVAAEQTVLAMLKEAGEGIGFLAEESHSSYETLPQGPVWVIDPLDGTTNFAHGFPIFAVSIAYAVGTLSKVGVVYAPMQDELFCACLGGGAWLNGHPIQVSGASLLQDSLLATGFPYAIATEVEGVMAALTRLLTRCQGVRRTGAAAVDLAYLACGRTDGFWEINLKPWDTAAAMLLVSEAGGRLTAYNGQEYTPYLPEVVASNGRIHAEMVGQLADFSKAGKE